MAVAIGKIHPFRPEQDDWNMYVERLDHLFVANGITGADKKRAILLSVIGDGTYKVLSSLLAPDKPGEKSFDDLVTVLKNHFCPVPSSSIRVFANKESLLLLMCLSSVQLQRTATTVIHWKQCCETESCVG